MFTKHNHLSVFQMACFCLSQNMIHKICKSEGKKFSMLLSLDKLFNNELHINYIPEIQNRFDEWDANR